VRRSQILSSPEADLWSLARSGAAIDADQLASALQRSLEAERPDFRTRLLIHDAAEALERFWGQLRFGLWKRSLVASDRLSMIEKERFDSTGFPSLRPRLMNRTKPETILEFLRELGTHAR
jgi:hypothetical protein